MKELPGGHVCDERCVCPIHPDLPLILHQDQIGYEHACQLADCEFGHGLETRLRELAAEGQSAALATPDSDIERPLILVHDEFGDLMAQAQEMDRLGRSWISLSQALRNALSPDPDPFPRRFE